MRVQSALSSVITMMAGSIIFASGSAVPAVDSKSSSSSTARSRFMHEARSSQSYVNVGDLSLGDDFVIKMNESVGQEIALPYDGISDLPLLCLGNATEDALQSLLETNLTQADLENVITVMQSNPQNTMPRQCNNVIIKGWVNVRNKDCFLNWQTLTKNDNAAGNFASQIAYQMDKGPSTRTCALPWVGDSTNAWCGGMAFTIFGVDSAFGLGPPLDANNWPGNDVLSKCGGEVQTSTYYTLTQTACKNCG